MVAHKPWLCDRKGLRLISNNYRGPLPKWCAEGLRKIAHCIWNCCTCSTHQKNVLHTFWMKDSRPLLLECWLYVATLDGQKTQSKSPIFALLKQSRHSDIDPCLQIELIVLSFLKHRNWPICLLWRKLKKHPVHGDYSQLRSLKKQIAQISPA